MEGDSEISAEHHVVVKYEPPPVRNEVIDTGVLAVPKQFAVAHLTDRGAIRPDRGAIREGDEAAIGHTHRRAMRDDNLRQWARLVTLDTDPFQVQSLENQGRAGLEQGAGVLNLCEAQFHD